MDEFRIANWMSFDYADSEDKFSAALMITNARLQDERNKFEVDGKLTVAAKINIRSEFHCYYDIASYVVILWLLTIICHF